METGVDIAELNGELRQLAFALMAELSAQPEAVSLARLCKRLGVRQSTLLRCIACLGSETVGLHAGLGWVDLQHEGERSLLSLTEEGRLVCGAQK